MGSEESKQHQEMDTSTSDVSVACSTSSLALSIAAGNAQYVQPLQSSPKKAPQVARLMRVLHSFSDGQPKHLKAREGDLVTLMKTSEKHRGWGLMRAEDGATGLFPLDYVVEQVDKPESHASFMDVDRREAERLLLFVGGEIGVFLVRPHNDPGTWTLSVLQRRDKERSHSKLHCVKHYIIVYNSGDRVYTIGNVTRSSFQVLLQYCQQYRCLEVIYFMTRRSWWQCSARRLRRGSACG